MQRAEIDSSDPLAASARELRPLLAANAAAVERERRLLAENVEALERRGLFTLMVPRRWGGHEAPPSSVLRVGAELAKGCASTAWVQTIATGSSWMASLLPRRGQEEIFAEGAPRICGVITPAPGAVRENGGWRIGGRWSYASGCLHASWAALAILLGETGGIGLAFTPLS